MGIGDFKFTVPIHFLMNIKKLTCLILVQAILFLVAVNVFALENSVSKTEVFDSTSKNQKYEFPKEIVQNNQKYRLENVFYEVVSETPETHTVHKTEIKTINNLYSKVYDFNNKSTLKNIPESIEITVGDKKHKAKLEKIEYKPTIISNRKTNVRTSIKSVKDKIQNTAMYEFKDTVTGKEVKVSLPKISVSEIDEFIENSISFPVIFHKVDTKEFVINNRNVPMLESGNTPISSDFFGDVKAESDYSDSDGDITKIVWNSGIYSSNGEMCRNALATLRTKEKLYIANYSDEVNLPDTDGYNAILTYIADIDEPTGIINYKIEATANYIPVEEYPMSPVFIGIGVLVFAVLISVILTVIVKNKKSKAERNQ